MDEVPRAYVVADPAVPLTQEDIIEYMDGKVSSIKKLAGGVVFTKAIPKTPVRSITHDHVHRIKSVELIACQAGKILRRQIREAAAKDIKL